MVMMNAKRMYYIFLDTFNCHMYFLYLREMNKCKTVQL